MQNKALRLAAWLLIAHFLVVAALSFAAPISPNYSHLFIKFAFLLGAAHALFAPRKRGWVPVVLYLVFILYYQLLGLWTIWSNAAMPRGTKSAMIFFWAVLNSLPVAALVLIFKPANVSALKSAPAESPTGEAVGPKA